MKQTRWLLGGLLIAMPVVLALPGCGGGNSGSNIFSPTPTSTPGTPVAQNLSAPVNFGNGQTGTLNLNTQGNAATGTLVVRAAGNNSIGKRSFNFAIPAGTYPISGSFTLPGSFSVSGDFPAPIGAFSITGTIPTTTQTGAFTVNANGETTSGTIPALNTLPTPAPTTPGTNPTPVGTPLPGVSGQLKATFSNASINASAAPFSGPAFAGAFGSQSGGNFGVDYKASGNRAFFVQLLNNFSGSSFADFKVGQQFNFSSSGLGTPGVAEVIYTAVIGVRTGQWSARSGKLTITSASATSVSYRLDNVHFAPGFVNEMGTGTFDLNGTGTASK